jgi:hypothetical protein
MGAPYSFPNKKTTDVFAALLIAQGPTQSVPQVFKLSSDPLTNPGVPIFRVFSNEEELTPRVEITASAKPERCGELITGNSFMSVHIRVCSHCDDKTRDQHYQLAGIVGDILFQKTADMCAALNGLGITDFTAQGQYYIESIDEKPVAHEFETDFSVSLKVAML